ncbi:MAG TPA: hypothetical protein VND01_00800 [Candidatus Acidoferrales bacterium]|nr:hypothetical protein [Candidatus Acidoferrales bacterium]
MITLMAEIHHWTETINLFCVIWVVKLANLQASWLWFLIGFLPLLVFIPAARVSTICPRERSWLLWPLRLFGRFIMVAIFLAVGLMLIIFKLALDYTFDIYKQEYGVTIANQTDVRLWSYIWGQFHVVGYGVLAGAVLGFMLWLMILWHVEPALVLHLRRWTKRNTTGGVTSASTISDYLPDPREYDPRAYFKKARKRNAIFFGVNENNKPVFISRDVWKQSHTQIMGPPGVRKGVQAAIALAQGIEYGDAVFIFDQKHGGDEWSPHVYADACINASKPFYIVDLSKPLGQLNLLAGSNTQELAELLIGAFSLGRTGGEGDFYRGDDRKAARKLAALIETGPICLASMYDQARDVLGEQLYKAAKAFLDQLDEVAELISVKTTEGYDLRAVIENGGCFYVIGSMRDEAVIILQRMVFLRVLQLVERRPRENARHVSILGDEFKYLFSLQSLNALGTIRDKKCNIVLTHQSLGDFGDCGPLLGAAQVQTCIVDNTPLKWLYRAKDERTAKWIAGMTGVEQVPQESFAVKPNEGMVDTTNGERHITWVSRYHIDVNQVQHLPTGCAVFISAGLAQLGFASPLLVPKYKFTLKNAPLYVRRMSAGEWLKAPLQKTTGTNSDNNAGGNVPL